MRMTSASRTLQVLKFFRRAYSGVKDRSKRASGSECLPVLISWLLKCALGLVRWSIWRAGPVLLRESRRHIVHTLSRDGFTVVIWPERTPTQLHLQVKAPTSSDTPS